MIFIRLALRHFYLTVKKWSTNIDTTHDDDDGFPMYSEKKYVKLSVWRTKSVCFTICAVRLRCHSLLTRMYLICVVSLSLNHLVATEWFCILFNSHIPYFDWVTCFQATVPIKLVVSYYIASPNSIFFEKKRLLWNIWFI